LEGIGRLRSFPALELRSSVVGVAEPGRESVRGRPVVLVVIDFELVVFALDGAFVVIVVFFFSGFSGAGHSTS
jgi:hypothetical protein